MSDDTVAWQLLLQTPDDDAGATGARFGGIRNAAKQRQRTMEKRMDHLLGVNQKVSEAMRSRKAFTEVRDLIRRSKVVVEVRAAESSNNANGLAAADTEADAPAFGDAATPSATAAASASYLQQGNLDMYTSENIKAREQNRFHPEVKAAIASFWEMLPKTNFGNVNKAIYKWYSRKLFFALVPKATEDEFQRVVEEDWKNDAVWTSALNWNMFRTAVFQLADIWCETTDPFEYRDFILKCTELVARPPCFSGNREDTESTQTTRRATVESKGGASRRQRKGEASEDKVVAVAGPGDSPSAQSLSTPLSALPASPVERFSEVEEEMLALEALDWEIFETEETAWLDTLRELADFHIQDREDTEEDILRLLRLIQDQRYELLRDDADRSFDFEGTLLAEIREALESRTKLRQSIEKALLSVVKPKPTLSFDARQQHRLRLAVKRKEGDEDLFGSIQETLLHGVVRARENLNTLLDLNKDTINHQLAAVAGGDTALITLSGLRLQDEERRHDMDAAFLDEVFNLCVAVSKDLKANRNLLAKRVQDPLGVEFYPNTRTGDNEVLKIKSKKWTKAIEWCTRQRQWRDEHHEDMVEELRSSLRKLHFKTKNQLMALHRQQMAAETKMIDIVANDVTIPHSDKMKHLHQLQQKKRDETARRSQELIELEAMLATMQEQLDQLTEGSSERREAEAAELRKWGSSAKTVADTFEASVPVLEWYQGDVSDNALLEGGSMAAQVNPVAPVLQPEDVQTAADLLLFVVEKGDEWWSAALQRLALLRFDMLQKFSVWMFERDCEEQLRLSELEVGVATLRLKQLEEYQTAAKEASGEEDAEDRGSAANESNNKKKSKMLADVLKVVDARLGMAEKYRALHERLTAAAKTTEGDVEKYQQLRLSRAAEQRAHVLKLYEFERLSRDQFRSLEVLRFRRVEGCYVRSMWLAMDTSHRSDSAHRGMHDACSKDESDNRERKRQENERLQRIRQQREAERRQLEEARLRRIEEEEREREEMKQRKDANLKRRAELRQRQLEERERLQKKRLEREREQRKEYRKELISNRQAREKSNRFRHHADIDAGSASVKQLTPHRPPEGGTSTMTAAVMSPGRPKPSTTTATKPPAAPTRATTKKYSGTAPIDPKAALAAQRRVLESSSPKSRARKAIEAEITSFQHLHTQSMQLSLETYAQRRLDYFVEELSNRGVYAAECRRLDAKHVDAVSRCLTDGALLFQMGKLEIADVAFDVLTIFDVLRLNPIQTLSLVGVGMCKDGCKKVCQALLTHPFASYIDVSRNPELGAHGGEALLSLATSNAHITRITAQHCGIPADLIVSINAQTDKNAFNSTIGRTEFEFIHNIFKELDVDGNGTISMDELREYNEKHSRAPPAHGAKEQQRGQQQQQRGLVNLRRTRATAPGLVAEASDTFRRLNDAMSLRLDQVRDVLLTLEGKKFEDEDEAFDLADLITFVYPSWKRADAEMLVAKYLDDSNTAPTLHELQEFIEAFGTSGQTVTLEQLARGLGESDPEQLRAAFVEADQDQDGFLSLEEFMRFVGA